jgi:hypothetical protein
MAARTRIFEINRPNFHLGFVVGYSAGRSDIQSTAADSASVSPQTMTPEMRNISPATVGSASTAKLASHSWSRIIGRYRSDPTWKDFGDFLKKYRKKTNRIYSQSTE